MTKRPSIAAPPAPPALRAFPALPALMLLAGAALLPTRLALAGTLTVGDDALTLQNF